MDLLARRVTRLTRPSASGDGVDLAATKTAVYMLRSTISRPVFVLMLGYMAYPDSSDLQGQRHDEYYFQHEVGGGEIAHLDASCLCFCVHRYMAELGPKITCRLWFF